MCIAKDLMVSQALLVTKVVFDGGAETVLSGVPGTWPDWEVNTVYRDTRVNINNPNSAELGRRMASACCRRPRRAQSLAIILTMALLTLRVSSGRRQAARTNRLGFGGYTGAGTALFRLRVLS
jgi:hypothetical protein